MLIACGVNHHTAPLELRERLAFRSHHFPDALYSLTQKPQVSEAAILSTCHRTELYCKAENEVFVLEWLCQSKALQPNDLNAHFYLHQNEEGVKHILRVASGLDSMVVGEPQIFGQVKEAFSLAQAAGTLGKTLYPLFHYTFATTKAIRVQTAIGCHPISFAYAVVTLAKRIFADFKRKTALLVGAGDMVEMMARYFHENNIYKIIIVNRTEARALQLAKRFNALAIGFSELEKYLIESDVVVSALSSPLPLIGKGLIERTLKKRKRRPQLLVDLGLPRNMEPEIHDLEDAYCYCLDDLQHIIQEGLRHRHDAAKQAEALIVEHAKEFTRYMQARLTAKAIVQFRKKAENIRDVEMQKAEAALKRGEDPTAVLQHFARLLTNKLIHGPSVKMYQAGYDANVELLEFIKTLL